MNNILIYFAIKYEGDWDKIYQALENKEKVPLEKIKEVEEKMKIKKWEVITILDVNYPSKLKHAYKPPFVIWIKGNFDLINKSTICATGNQVNEQIINKISDAVTCIESKSIILSPGFNGVDEYVNKFAKNGVIHILANGINKSKLKDGDLFISEYHPDLESNSQRYKHRNRLISSFADYLVLFSSYSNGKMNHMVSSFLNMGKEIYCYPGDGSKNDGNSELIKQGANYITNISDIK